MSNDLLDYKASVPSSTSGGIAPIALPAAPASIQLADLGIFIVPPVPSSNRIELKGTVGLQALTGNSNVVLRIFRLADGVSPGLEIFNKTLTAESAPAETFYTASFSTIDFNVSASTGFIVYNLTGEVTSAETSASVIGPIAFTGLAIGNVT